MAIRLSSLAHNIMMLANQGGFIPGDALPHDMLELLLESAPEKVEAAFDEIYAHNLLEEIDCWIILTEEGFNYVLNHVRRK
ncbi:hypothetical protein OP853_004833 [Salmonella enterica]|nr:hypothetical protein [Salmonella enterica]